MLLFREVKLKVVTHRGAISTELLSALSHFKDLTGLSIEDKNEAMTPEKKTTVLDFLQRLPYLTNLNVDLGAVSLPPFLPSVTMDQFPLRSLGLKATTKELMAYLQVGPQFLHLQSLDLYIYSTTNLCWKSFFEGIRSSFPKLEELRIDMVDATGCPPLRMRDLEVLIPQNMTYLQVSNDPILPLAFSASRTSFGTASLVGYVAASRLRGLKEFHVLTDSPHLTSISSNSSCATESNREYTFRAPS